MDIDRKKLNRLWLLFVVFATGLVWTWSQVGQRSAKHMEVSEESITLLRTETGCDLALSACAAYGANIGLVASAKLESDGVAWRVKLVGRDVPALPRVLMWLLPPGSKPQQLPVVQTADQWQAHSKGLVPNGSMFRVRIEGGAQPLIADFPLRSSR